MTAGPVTPLFKRSPRKFAQSMEEISQKTDWMTRTQEIVAGPGPGTQSRRSNRHLVRCASSASGNLSATTPPLFKNRPDSRTGYLPCIDIPEVHHVKEACAENLYEFHADAAARQPSIVRSDSAPPEFYASNTKKSLRREEFHRIGNNLQDWRTGNLDNYRCILPHGSTTKPAVGASLPYPGLILPAPLTTSQGLFGPGPHKVGPPKRLRSIATSVDKTLPKFMVHDVLSCTSSTHANFHKTGLSFGSNPGAQFSTEQKDVFKPPPTAFRQQSNYGSTGIKTEIFGRTFESSGQQPWRQ